MSAHLRCSTALRVSRLGRSTGASSASAASAAAVSTTFPFPSTASTMPLFTAQGRWPLRPTVAAYRALSAQHAAAFHRTAVAAQPRRSFFTSNVLLRPDRPEQGSGGSTTAAPSTTPAAVAAKRKLRTAGAKYSLRRVAVIAQQQHPAGGGPADDTPAAQAVAAAAAAQKEGAGVAAAAVDALADDGSNVISAVCLAESFAMDKVMAALQQQGYTLDPDGSGFESHEVVHGRRRWPPGTAATDPGSRDVDLFVFESGTLVGWGLPVEALEGLAGGRLVATGSAVDPFVAERETETLEFRRDPQREASAMRGDVVVLGTRREAELGDRLATTLAMIAFSSGLARSTKLAVLEGAFSDYFESTRRIPAMLARPRHSRRPPHTAAPRASWITPRGWVAAPRGWGGLGHLSQDFILQKTGELLSLRAQLNHYRELTDSLPDIFWDARAELGLEGYYEQVGRALDVGVRIKTLNQKMDYAQEIATVLREISSERHGARLEWIIIVLITVEVVFELRRVYLEWPGAGHRLDYAPEHRPAEAT